MSGLTHESIGLLHDESSTGLRAIRGPFAQRMQIWPPADFVEPIEEELDLIKGWARRGLTGVYLRRKSDGVLRRTVQVIAWFGARRDADTDVKLYDYLHEVRRETSRRKLIVNRINILRCYACTHATERLFEATPETHNITADNEDPTATPQTTMLCAQCWSLCAYETKG